MKYNIDGASTATNENIGNDTSPFLASSRSSPSAAPPNMIRKLSKNQINKTICKMSGYKFTFIYHGPHPKGIVANVYLASTVSKTFNTLFM